MSNSESVARDEFFDSLLGDFLDESGQLLDRLNEDLRQLDDQVRSLGEADACRRDDDLLNNMFRSAHSLKGLSAMLGLGDINNLTHKIENVFDAARKDDLIIDGDVVELMFQAVDRLVNLVDALKEPDSEPVDCEAVQADIARMLQAAGVAREQTSQADAERALQEELAEEQAAPPPGGADLCNAQAVVAESITDEAAGEVARTAEPQTFCPSSTKIPSGDTPAEESSQSSDPPPQTLVDFFEGLEDECEPQSKYLGIFIDETELSLDQLTETLLTMEKENSPKTAETLLVIAHRIKGSAASVGLNRAAKLAHLMEDLLQNLVDTSRSLSPDVTDALLKCSDALRLYVEGLKQGHGESDQFNHLAHELLAAQVSEEPGPAAESTRPDVAADVDNAPVIEGISEALREAVAKFAADRETAMVGRVSFEHNLPLVGLKARLVFEKLSNLGDVCCFDPPEEALDDLTDLAAVSFGLTTERSLDDVRRPLRIAGVAGVVIERLVPETAPSGPEATIQEPHQDSPGANAAVSTASQPAAKVAPAAKTRSADSAAKPTETLRVDIERLDQLMNLAGQLVINKARFTRIGDRLKGVLTSKQSSRTLDNVFGMLDKMAGGGDGAHVQADDLQTEIESIRTQARRIQNDLESVRRDVDALGHVRSSVNDLAETIHQLDRVSDGIQQSVMDTRMLPIGPLFGRFKRVIRDITRSNGKSIRLVINGEKTELDKRMIDELGDPLIHMVRNSADHGIELPEVREAAGKPRQGTVTLDAFHRGNSIVIQVTDDGKGLDPDRIRRKALDKGLLTEADLERMTPHQIYQLIWEPGLSTAEKVTEVSGRGMGMDIVKSKIEDLNGVVDLDSEPGKGTKLTIKLPLTLAILPSLMTEIDGDILAMPLESVVEIVSVQRKDLTTVQQQWTARVRGRIISVVKLDGLFTWNHASHHSTARAESDEVTLVIVGEEGREIGLAVHEVLGEEDIVIKSMAENYRNVPGIAGASILGDGRVSLILDLAALIDMAANRSIPSAVS